MKVLHKRNMNKKGQVTIFIIVSILIIAGLIAALWFLGKFSMQEKEKLTPRTFVQKCVRDAVFPSVEAVLQGGGRVNPDFYKLHEGKKYNYLCYAKNYYESCVNHYPQLKEIVEQEIKSASRKKVQQCFSQMEEEWKSRGFSVESDVMDFEIILVPKRVVIKLSKNMRFVKGDDSQSFNEFDTAVLSPLYDLVYVAREIVNQESEYCNFEYGGFMAFYPNYNIKKIDYDESKIYKIIDRSSGNEFKFAVRSCALPPGI